MEEQQTMDEWEDVKPEVWKPVEGDSIVGVLTGKKEGQGNFKSNAYYVDTGNGICMVWGTTTLDDRMSAISVGEKIRITFKRTDRNKIGQPVKIFSVERAKARAL